jgi:hypothetical protein
MGRPNLDRVSEQVTGPSEMTGLTAFENNPRAEFLEHWVCPLTFGSREIRTKAFRGGWFWRSSREPWSR